MQYLSARGAGWLLGKELIENTHEMKDIRSVEMHQESWIGRLVNFTIHRVFERAYFLLSTCLFRRYLYRLDGAQGNFAVCINLSALILSSPP